MAHPIRYLSALGLAIAAPIFALMSWQPAGAAVFNPESFTLSNGMKVVVITNHRAPVVTHMVWYKVGAADDPMGKSGIAHMFEHLMFKAPRRRASENFQRSSPATAAVTTPLPRRIIPPTTKPSPSTGWKSSCAWRPTACAACF